MNLLSPAKGEVQTQKQRGHSLQDTSAAATLLQGTGNACDVAQEARRKRRRAAIFSFILMVVMPTLVTAFYYYFFARDIYVAESRFIVRSSENPAAGKLGFLGAIGSPVFSADSHAVINYIHSTDLIAALEKELPVRGIFEKGDWLSAPAPHWSLEEFRKYWKKMVRVRYDGQSEAIILTVRTFAAEDSIALARTIVRKSEELVNRLSRQGRLQTLRFAREDVAKAEERLVKILSQIRQLRMQTGIFEPKMSISARSKLMAQLAAEISQLKVRLETRQKLLGDKAPGIEAMRSQMKALQEELEALKKGGIGTVATEDLPQIFEAFDKLKVQMNFAEKSYVNALSALEAARAKANRNVRYLAEFVRPTKIESPTEPKRLHIVLMVAILAFLGWGILGLIVLGIREHIF